MLIKTWHIILFNRLICAKVYFTIWYPLSQQSRGCHFTRNITTNHNLPVVTWVTKSWRDGVNTDFTHACLAVYKQRDWLSVKLRFLINETLDRLGFNATATTRNKWSVVNKIWSRTDVDSHPWLQTFSDWKVLNHILESQSSQSLRSDKEVWM